MDEQAEKRPVGRPKKTLDDLPSNWKEIMILLGQEGGSRAEVQCALGMNETTWYRFLDEYEEFSQTEKERKTLSEAWWNHRGREMVNGSKGDSTVWIFNMKNRFGWKDRIDVDNRSSDRSMSPGNSILEKASSATLESLINDLSKSERPEEDNAS
jgi:hypothetical protein